MPYIKQENRPRMNNVIEELYRVPLGRGELIYILFEYCKQHIRPSYNNYKNFCGELRQCATEIERRTGAKEASIVNEDVDFDYIIKYIIRKDICDKKIAFMKEGADIKVNGDLNYILYAYCIRHKTAEEYSEFWNKARYSEFAQELRLTAKAITKEILAPYEDVKIAENGDVL